MYIQKPSFSSAITFHKRCITQPLSSSTDKFYFLSKCVWPQSILHKLTQSEHLWQMRLLFVSCVRLLLQSNKLKQLHRFTLILIEFSLCRTRFFPLFLSHSLCPSIFSLSLCWICNRGWENQLVSYLASLVFRSVSISSMCSSQFDRLFCHSLSTAFWCVYIYTPHTHTYT